MRSAFLLLLIIGTYCSFGQTFSLSDSTFKLGAIYRPKIYFPFDSRQIKPESYPLLDSIAVFLVQQKQLVVELGCHVDSVAYEHEKNWCTILYLRQGRSVLNYLLAKGVDSARLRWKDYRYSQQLVYTKKWCNQNTRTEFKIVEIDKP
jgi:outer membrane protein OmpA-like peptidoglycan-associated protein